MNILHFIIQSILISFLVCGLMHIYKLKLIQSLDNLTDTIQKIKLTKNSLSVNDNTLLHTIHNDIHKSFSQIQTLQVENISLSVNSTDEIKKLHEVFESYRDDRTQSISSLILDNMEKTNTIYSEYNQVKMDNKTLTLENNNLKIKLFELQNKLCNCSEIKGATNE